MPESVFMETIRNSKLEFPPARISPCDVVLRGLRQTRTSTERITNACSRAPYLDTIKKRRDCIQCVSVCQLTTNLDWRIFLDLCHRDGPCSPLALLRQCEDSRNHPISGQPMTENVLWGLLVVVVAGMLNGSFAAP